MKLTPKSQSPLLGFAPAALTIMVLGLGSCRGVYEKTELDPEAQLDVYVTTATYLYEDGSLDRAQDQAVKALELDPENRAMRRMIGWIRLRQGTTEGLLIAEDFFRDLAAEGDETQATVVGLATTLERLGIGHDRASQDFASGKRTPPDGAPADEKAREMAKRARDLFQESIDLYENSLTDGEGSVRTINGLQRVTALLGRYEESLGWSEKLLANSTAELADWQRMLRSENLTADEEELLRTNEQETLQLQLDTHLFASSLSNYLGRTQEALDHLDAAIEIAPERTDVYSLRAQLRVELGAFQPAIEDIDRFLKLSPLAFEHEDIQKAFELRATCEQELAIRAR